MKIKFLLSLFLGSALSMSAQGYLDGVEYYRADQFYKATSFSTLVQSIEIILLSAYLTSTHAVSILNSQEIILAMLSSQKQK